MCYARGDRRGRGARRSSSRHGEEEEQPPPWRKEEEEQPWRDDARKLFDEMPKRKERW
jgi:hypothetical protein